MQKIRARRILLKMCIIKTLIFDQYMIYIILPILFFMTKKLLIVGAGPVGLAAALFVSKNP